jgi:hypothetical protein
MTDRLLRERDVRAMLHRLRDQTPDNGAAGWFNAAALELTGLPDAPPPQGSLGGISSSEAAARMRRLTRIVPWDEGAASE